MRVKIRDRLAALIGQNQDPNSEEMMDRARAAIEVTKSHSDLTEQQRAEVQRLLSSVRREVAVIRLRDDGSST